MDKKLYVDMTGMRRESRRYYQVAYTFFSALERTKLPVGTDSVEVTGEDYEEFGPIGDEIQGGVLCIVESIRSRTVARVTFYRFTVAEDKEIPDELFVSPRETQEEILSINIPTSLAADERVISINTILERIEQALVVHNICILEFKLGELASLWRANYQIDDKKCAEVVREYHQVIDELKKLGWTGENLLPDQELPDELMPEV